MTRLSVHQVAPNVTQPTLTPPEVVEGEAILAPIDIPADEPTILPQPTSIPFEDGTLTKETELILQYYDRLSKSTSGPVLEKIKLKHTPSATVFFYERLRNAMDNKSDHLLRRNTIERILRRLLWENPLIDPQTTADLLIRELIWGRYVQNDTVTMTQLTEIGEVLKKYFLYFKEMTSSLISLPMNNGDLRSKILSIASAEIEEIIDPSLGRIDVWCQAMVSWFEKRYLWHDSNLSEEQKNREIFVAIHRTLLRSDEPRILYHSLKRELPNWKQGASLKSLSLVLDETIKTENSQTQAKLFRLMSKQVAQFNILKDLIDLYKSDTRSLLENPQDLQAAIKKICTKRYKEIDQKIRSGIIRSTIYILLTKFIVILALEIPYEMITGQTVNVFVFLFNLFISPILMFILGQTIKKPGDSNTKVLIDRVEKLVYPSEIAKVSVTMIETKRTGFYFYLFNSIYFTIFILTFGIIIYLLTLMSFNVLNILIFFLFLSLVLLFGYRIQYTTLELFVEDHRESFINKLMADLALPFLNLGVWLSKGLSNLNVLTMAMDIIIEMPLKTFVEIGKEWNSFVKEKKEEIIEVPIQ